MATDAVEIRSAAKDWDAVADLVEKVFSTTYPPEEREVDLLVFDPERSIGAYAGQDLVGHACIFSGPSTSVPGGGGVPMALVSIVGVLATHRRRGVLTSLMRHQLTDLHDNGREPIAVLTASEPAIYGRFGYGLATEHVSVEIPRTARDLRPVAGVDEVTIAYADPEQSLEVCNAVRESVRPSRPGMFEHDERWRRRISADPAATREGASALRCVLATRDGTVTGYAYYRTAGGWVDKKVNINRLHATDLASHVALWRFLLDQDLIHATTHGRVPLDDPLLSLLLDVRKPSARVWDGLWLRLVDLDRALSARAYAAPVDLVLDVRDPFCPWNTGRWRLAGDASGAECTSTTAAADVVLDVRELGAVYLGRPSLTRLAAAGLVEERTPGAVAALSRAFASDVLPICDTGF